ncbi:hypothetical protein GCK72_004181 [Caenorhabditis remanei]|uniref:Uncharacterized protein n=1 Tax=Caenorhabditis remanei TaxID=31234 RepID=A0A6A5HBQ9_CAERE|nr:hypothetical protein GCK72_004181 [Caenorhabditis remanei]KAF1764234.1 hypothetical protein GCK72_004181 [Caenorhabditis remanei]
MFSSTILIILTTVLAIVNAGRHHHYHSNSYRGYGNGVQRHGYPYRTPPWSYSNYYQNYRTPYRTPYYQGYSNYYQGYRTPYYGNYYQPYQQPSTYYGSGDRYIGNGIHVDSHGNGYIGRKDTGWYIFCASRGCVGRG